MSDENVILRLRANDCTVDSVCVHGDIELHQVCAAIQDNSNIRRFTFLSGVVVDLNAANAISTALERMPDLEDFTISLYDFMDLALEATVILASALGNKRSMRNLTLTYTSIGDKGAEAIVSSFRRNTELRSLVLSHNNIGNDGAIAIASLIESNHSLIEVRLNGNSIGTEGDRSLAKAVTQHPNLCALTFGTIGQTFSDAAEEAFMAALYNDESIETVISRSNHNIGYLGPIGEAIGPKLLLDLNKDGPEMARQAKIIRFLNSKPRSLLSMNLHETGMPLVLDKVGRDRVLNTMFEVVRNIPDLFNVSGTQPHQ